MNVCPTCGYKVISNTMFKRHLETHIIDVKEVPEGTRVEAVEPPKPVENENEITIHFSKSIEVRINGVLYEGKDITLKNISIASEIVRIARDAYGPTILI